MRFKDAYKTLDRELTKLQRGGGVDPDAPKGALQRASEKHGIHPKRLSDLYAKRLAKTRGALETNIQSLKGLK